LIKTDQIKTRGGVAQLVGCETLVRLPMR